MGHIKSIIIERSDNGLTSSDFNIISEIFEKVKGQRNNYKNRRIDSLKYQDLIDF